MSKARTRRNTTATKSGVERTRRWQIMRVSRLYVKQALSDNHRVSLEAETSHYLKNVLRLKAGATVDLFNSQDDNDYRGVLDINGKQLDVVIEQVIPRPPLPRIQTSIVQGLAKSDHVDWTIQKSTELGVHQLHLFNARYTQSPLKAAQREKKLKHWQGVAISACEQCGRTRIPSIYFHADGIQCLDHIEAEQKVLLDFDAPAFRADGIPPKALGILLGPEGGLENSEIDYAKSRGFAAVSLGPRVLRTETAAITALAIAQSNWGDW